MIRITARDSIWSEVASPSLPRKRKEEVEFLTVNFVNFVKADWD
jgi:hypothetical protein